MTLIERMIRQNLQDQTESSLLQRMRSNGQAFKIVFILAKTSPVSVFSASSAVKNIFAT